MSLLTDKQERSWMAGTSAGRRASRFCPAMTEMNHPGCALSVQATRHVQRFAGDVGSIIRSKERHRRRDLLDLADPAERGGGFDPLAHVTFGQPCGNHAFGGDHAGVDGVDAELSARQLL